MRKYQSYEDIYAAVRLDYVFGMVDPETSEFIDNPTYNILKRKYPKLKKPTFHRWTPEWNEERKRVNHYVDAKMRNMAFISREAAMKKFFELKGVVEEQFVKDMKAGQSVSASEMLQWEREERSRLDDIYGSTGGNLRLQQFFKTGIIVLNAKEIPGEQGEILPGDWVQATSRAVTNTPESGEVSGGSRWPEMGQIAIGSEGSGSGDLGAEHAGLDCIQDV